VPNGGKLINTAIIIAAILLSWTFRYETVGFGIRAMHVNRFTGAMCPVSVECWFHD
jgi:hypothetical protein